MKKNWSNKKAARQAVFSYYYTAKNVFAMLSDAANQS